MNKAAMTRMIRLRASVSTTALLCGIFLSYARSVSTFSHPQNTRFSGTMAPVSPLSEYMLPRNVTIRPNWNPSKMLPIHIYHGPSVPARNKPEINWNEKDIFRKLEGLSKKSQALLETYTSLSNNNDNAELDKLRDKMAAEVYAASPLDPAQHLHILYLDEHICVTHKPSGVLSVPGPRRNPSLADLVYNAVQPPDIDVDQMVVSIISCDQSAGSL
jgi:hypothetical protein